MSSRDQAHAVAEMLNSAFQSDSNAVHSLICNRVPCNLALADHPEIVVEDAPVLGVDGLFSVGTLGVVNGIVGMLTGLRVAIKWSDPREGDGRRTLLGFCVVDKEGNHVP